VWSIERIETPAGDPAWHVRRHADVKALLADQRLGRGHPDPARAGRYAKDDIAGRPASGSETEHVDHTVWRRAMNKVFSPAALERMTPVVRDTAARVAEDLAGQSTPVDLKHAYSTRLTSLVMCSLLGVPPEDIETWRRWTEEGAQTTNLTRSMDGMKRLMAYAARLVAQRRDTSSGNGGGAISMLVAAGDGSRGNDGRVVKLLAGMLAFGRETPASVLDWGTLLLLTHSQQAALLRTEPTRVVAAVEEILRLFKPHAATEHGLQRYAHTDIDVGGTTIHAGEMVLLDVMRANRDPEVFSAPDRFDITRTPNPHLTFGYGSYMCNFTKLGRIEISIGLATLFARFPGLRLAAPPDRLQEREHLRTGGLAELPVAW
jgi:cytochrome P450